MAAELREGGCHCGAVRYRAKLDLEQPVIVCNCSICKKAGTMLSAVSPDDFTLLQGEDALTTYRFNTHKIAHQFCKTCGILPFGEGTDPKGNKTAAINIRCLEDFDFTKVPLIHYDGKSL